MFSLESNVMYFMCQHPVNMRKGIDSLFNLVVSESPMSPMTGDVLVFFSKNRQTVKLLRWDTDGFLLYQKDNPDAKEVAELANSLYQNEHRHKVGDDWTVDDNLRWRQEYAPPILKALKSNLKEIRDNTAKYPPKSVMHKAANYFLNEWDGIEAIANYGDVDWDNNRLERINRYISLSRHSSLFFGSHEGAKRECVFYSLACSCRNNGINFFDYLSDVLNKAVTLPPESPAEAYRNLLPDKWMKNEQDQ